MLLSDALFEQVTSTLCGEPFGARTPASPTPEQRRRETRVGVRATVTIIPLSDGLQIAPFDVPVRDLSAGGIGFVHKTKMSLDEQFVVLLPGGNESNESVAVLCEVAHYQPLAAEACAIGARFVRVLRQPAGGNDRGTTLGLPARPTVARRAAS